MHPRTPTLVTALILTHPQSDVALFRTVGYRTRKLAGCAQSGFPAPHDRFGGRRPDPGAVSEDDSDVGVAGQAEDGGGEMAWLP